MLLVEDDRELRATLRDALAGRRATRADRGQPGRCAARCWRSSAAAAGIDLVLLDLGLPDGDGESLARTLRRQPALPVIVISARDGDGSKIRLLDAGADDYLVKPFSVGELLARMRVALRHRGTRVAAGGHAL